jgi:very-short-patch-repair endonuclease
MQLSPDVFDTFRRHHGMATARMLSAAGLSRRVRDQLVRSGALVCCYERVYWIVSSPLTIQARCAALCLAYPRGFVTGPTAGSLLGLRRMPRSADVVFAVPHGSNIGPLEGVRVRQTRTIRKVDVVHQHDGINVASPPRLVFDLAADLGALDHQSVVEQVLADRLCTLGTLARVGGALVHPARRGSQRFVLSLLARGEGPAAESHGEVELGALLRTHGVPVVRQLEGLPLPNGRRIRVDLAVPEVRWAVEIDLHPDHLLLDGTTRDKRRDRQCHLIGWQVERVTAIDMLDPASLADELAALYRARAAALAA